MRTNTSLEDLTKAWERVVNMSSKLNWEVDSIYVPLVFWKSQIQVDALGKGNNMVELTATSSVDSPTKIYNLGFADLVQGEFLLKFLSDNN